MATDPDEVTCVAELHPDDLKEGLPILPGLFWGYCAGCKGWTLKQGIWWWHTPAESNLDLWHLDDYFPPTCCLTCTAKVGAEGWALSLFFDYAESQGVPESLVAENDPYDEGTLLWLFEKFWASLSQDSQIRLDVADFTDKLYNRDVASGVLFAHIQDFLLYEEMRREFS